MIYQEMLWECSFGYKNLLNFTCHAMKFHNCHHANPWCKIKKTHGLTLGNSLRWLASNSNSSRLLAYLIISSGTWDKLQWLLLIYSTCRLHPLNNGIHLNIVVCVRFHSTVTPFISIAVPLSNGNQIKIDTFLNAKFSRQITLKLALLKWTK